MSTAEHSSISLRDARPLQTFIAPVEACPVALSVLWIPIPRLPKELAGNYTEVAFHVTLSHFRSSHNPRNAIRHFLEQTVVCERKNTLFFLKAAEEPPLGLMRYTVSLEDWRLSAIREMDLLNIAVVINSSPPSEELLGKLISSGTIGLGVYAGLSIVPEEANPYLLMSCVSGGIICVSTAAGIGRALQDGIYQRLLSFLVGTSNRKKERK